MQEKSGKVIDALIAPPLSFEVEYLWSEYVHIKSGVSGDGGIQYRDLDAYQRVTGVELSPWESSLIFEIDRLRKKNG